MSWAKLAVVRSTAAVFVAGRRAGSAVLVDDRHLVTARHVLLRRDPTSGSKDPVEQAEVEFPGAGPNGNPRTIVTRLDLGIAANGVDISVLQLGQLLLTESRPVPVWPAGRLPERVAVFGYPLAEGALSGVWREFTVAGPTTSMTVQLDWDRDAGTFPGHSGGPVIAAETGELVGILVQGSKDGRFDRFVPVPLIAQLWPQLQRRWLMTGPEGRSHFDRRARGLQSRTRGGDLFRGRSAALAAVRGWLTASDSPELPLAITGQPGAGKSSTLARTVLALEAEGIGPGLAFHARDATDTDLLDAVADLAGLDHGMSRDALVDALREAHPSRAWRIAVDAVDEAATAQARLRIVETLSELAELPQTRVAVATRALTVSERERYLPGSLLYGLGVTGAESLNMVDLDTDRYFEPVDLTEFAAAMLAQDGIEHPGPEGRAWAHYQAYPTVRRRLALVIAHRADRNYLVAAMSAHRLSRAMEPRDPADPEFDEREVEAGVGDALSKYLDGLPDTERKCIRALLVALAYARGAGVIDALWLRFAAALGYPVSTIDLDHLRASAAADYLLQTMPDVTGPATRLFHQALADELLARRVDQRGADEQRLLDTLLTDVRTSGGWLRAGNYPRQHACEHAAVAGQLAYLLEEPHYLAVADFLRLQPLLSAPLLSGNPTATVVRQVGTRATPFSPSRRARLLALTAAHLGFPDVTRRLAASCSDGIIPRWGHSFGVPHQELAGHTHVVVSVALGRIGDRDVIVSGSTDETVRIWDADDGQPIGQPLTGHTSIVESVVLGRVGDRDVIVSGSADGTVRIWNASNGQPIGPPLGGRTGFVTSVALGRVGDRDVIVSGSIDGTLRMWDALDRQPIGAPLTGHTGGLHAVVLGRVGDRDVIVSGGSDKTLRIWDAHDGQPVGPPLTGHTSQVNAVVLGRVGDRDVIVSGGSDDKVRIWDAHDGQPIDQFRTGSVNSVEAVALGKVGNRDVIVSGGSDHTVRMWNAHDGQPIGAPLNGHTGGLHAVALGRVGDRDVIVSGSHDHTVRIWNANDARPTGEPLTRHMSPGPLVALGCAGDHDRIVSGFSDGTVRIWDADGGQPIGAPLTGHTSPVNSVAMGRVGGRDLIVSGSADRTVRIWNARDGQPIGQPLTGHTSVVTSVALGRVGDRDVIVSGSLDRTVRIWNAHGGQPVCQFQAGRGVNVKALALGRIGDRDVIVSGGSDKTLRIWDAVDGQPIGQPLTGHTSAIESVALGRIDDRDVIVSGSLDHTVRVWDAHDGQPIGAPLTGHTAPVMAVALERVGDSDLIVSGSYDGTVRIWDPTPSNDCRILDTLGPVSAVAVGCNGTLSAIAGRALCTFTIRPGNESETLVPPVST